MTAINQEFFDNKKDQIDNATTCEQLKILSSDLQELFNGYFDSIEDQLARLAPILEIPTDLGEVIDWITNVIGVYLKPYNDLLFLQAQYLVQFQDLIASIVSKISDLGCSFSPPIPPTI